MKSVPSVAYLACGLAATCRMVDSFAPTTTSSPTIKRSHTMRSEPATTQLFDDDDARATFTSTSLRMGYGRYGDGRSSPRNASHQHDRTKRQERVGHVVRSELATILHRGSSIKGDDDPIEQELRRRINVVHTDVSPDLRHARITVSIMAAAKKGGGGGGGGGGRGADSVARRRAYAWLVRNTKAIRHSLAQRMKHMKASPDLTFVQVDVGAAVDVMHLIERVASEGYKRDDVLEMDFEEEWDEEDGDGGDDDGWFDFDEEGDGISVEVEA